MSTAATILNLESEVILKTENRTTDTARADVWIRDALIELTSNPEYRDSFPELEVLGPPFNLTGGTISTAVQEYAESNFVTAGDFNVKTLQVFLWTDFGTNLIRKELDPTTYQDANKFQSYPSIPAQWYRYGNNIGFWPMPNLGYQVQARYMKRHPITDYFNANGLLNSTPILMPLEWNEIIEWSAAMRGFMELLEFDKAAELRTMLYGDVNEPGKPGLIKGVISRRRAEAWQRQQPLRPVVKSSCWGNQ